MDITTIYNDVRRDYFPRWDRKHEWKFETVDDLSGAVGCCSPKTKTLRVVRHCIKDEFDFVINVKLTLIHELAHAVGRCAGHRNKGWVEQMIRASQTAEKLGEMELAQRLTDEVKQYKILPKFNVKSFHAEIIDHVADSYDRIIRNG